MKRHSVCALLLLALALSGLGTLPHVALADGSTQQPPTAGKEAKTLTAEEAALQLAEEQAKDFEKAPNEPAFIEVKLFLRLTGTDLKDHKALVALFDKFPLMRNYVPGQVISLTATYKWAGWEYDQFAAAINDAGGKAEAPVVRDWPEWGTYLAKGAQSVLIKTTTTPWNRPYNARNVPDRLLGDILPNPVHQTTTARGKYVMFEYAHDVAILDGETRDLYAYSMLPAKGLGNPVTLARFDTWKGAVWFDLWNRATLAENHSQQHPMTTLVIWQLPPKREMRPMLPE
ncbi:MAG TPA: hypothetical protein VKU00_22825 [Chthonomonadaceae bacterium]|nr:hypothetical protein [Chthonomonadaceae bacterium]